MTNEPTDQTNELPGDGGDNGAAWMVFAELFARERGYTPHVRDSQHRELFHWFILGSVKL